MQFQVGDFVMFRRKPEREIVEFGGLRGRRLFMVSGVSKHYIQIVDLMTLAAPFRSRVLSGTRQKGEPPNYWYRADLFKRR